MCPLLGVRFHRTRVERATDAQALREKIVLSRHSAIVRWRKLWRMKGARIERERDCKKRARTSARMKMNAPAMSRASSLFAEHESTLSFVLPRFRPSSTKLPNEILISTRSRHVFRSGLDIFPRIRYRSPLITCRTFLEKSPHETVE